MKSAVIFVTLLLGWIAMASPPPKLLDNNLKCVDLSDLKGPIPLAAV